MRTPGFSRFGIALLTVLATTACPLRAEPPSEHAPHLREAVSFVMKLRDSGGLPAEAGGATARLAVSGVPATGPVTFPLEYRLIVTPPDATHQLVFKIRRHTGDSPWELVDEPPQRRAAREPVKVSQPALRAELLIRRDADQAIRTELRGKGPAPDSEASARVRAIDDDNVAWLKALIAEHGWPHPGMVGPDGAAAAWLIVQHADLGFQKEMLPVIRAEYAAGRLSGGSFALLQDRVLVGEGKPQIYGSQFESTANWVDGEPKLMPIADEAHVDQRRAEVGLEPLAEYVKRIKESHARRPASN